MKATSSVAPAPQALRLSPWHTPVPYFFGGLAILLGLIAFALLMLACSYGNLDGDVEDSTSGDVDLEAGDSKPDNNDKILVFEEKYVVIMAGKETPTYLATPVSSRATSFESCTCSCESNLTDKTTSF